MRVELAYTTFATTSRDSNIHAVCRGPRAVGGGAGDVFVTSTVFIIIDNSSRTNSALTRGRRELLSLRMTSHPVCICFFNFCIRAKFYTAKFLYKE